MFSNSGSRTPHALRPRAQALALEPRILFDGAVAAAVEQHHADAHHATADTGHAVKALPALNTLRNADTAAGPARASTDSRSSPGPARHADAEPATSTAVSARASAAAPINLVVIDSRVADYAELLTQLPASSKVLVINSGDNAIARISAALAGLGKVDSIQIFSHGAAGQFTLGDQAFTADTLSQSASSLAAWRADLNPGADIQLYGCDVGAGTAGRALVDKLAAITGADVAASSNATGNASVGADWQLETTHGDIDKAIALSANALGAYHDVLANANPTVTVSAGGDVLLGTQATFEVTLTNASSQVGYGPFIDLLMPATGKDGNDGLSFVSASYLGQSVTAYVLTFDSNGQAVHPLARDSAGNALVINAASYGLRAGDQLVVLQLPFGSVSQAQPAITVQVTAALSNLADTSLTNGAPDLTVQARGGFQFGNDALDNPTADPSLVEAALQSVVFHPTLVTVTQTLDMTEGETTTGPNYVHNLTVTGTPASGQTLSDVVITHDVPGAVQVTAITPGGGGTLTALTLADGRTLTDPTLMQAAIASDTVFITRYTVSYTNVSAPISTVVSFYVPQSDANGQPILNPTTGAPVTIAFAAPTATGDWVPLDPRDSDPVGSQIDFTGTGSTEGGSFVATSITLSKTVTISTDAGSSGLSPGDTLGYTLNVAISDYFAFGETLLRNGHFEIVDQLSDGQTLTGTPTFTFSSGGVSHTVALVVTSTVNADGSTTLHFDLAASALNGISEGALIGDLAFDNNQEGATTATISYNALVDQRYTSTYRQSEINEGDTLGNNATVTGTLLVDSVNLSGASASDGSSTTSTVPTHTVDINIASVNGGAPPSSGELNPGDVVTFTLSYDLVTGDYEQLKLTAYLPLPLLDLAGITWSQGSGVGQWHLGAGNTNADAIDSVTTAAGNAVVFNFGDYATAVNGSRIELVFTLRVGDTPYADQRSLNVLAQSDQLTTQTQQHLVSSDVAEIVSVAEPDLSISHGVVSASAGSVTGATGSWNAPGSSGVPFSGSITDPGAVNGDVTGIDAGDTVRLATALENTGGGGAFNVQTLVTLPTGLSFVGGSLAAANLQIYRGDGTQLLLGTDYSVSGSSITFLDAGGVATLAPGRSGTSADTSGHNVVVITYDVSANSGIAAASTLQTSATLSHYASVAGGTDFTPTDVVDTANAQMASPNVSTVFKDGTLTDDDSTAAQTTGANLVIGEGMTYDLVVTLPEGSTQNLRLDDLIPAGMRLDTSFNGGLGYQLITTAAGSGALAADFGGTVTMAGVSGIGGALGNDGIGARWTFSNASATADNNSGNNSFVMRVVLVADNASGNQAGITRSNSAQLVFSDPDGDSANGSVALDRTVMQQTTAPVINIVEPTLTVTQTLATDPGVGVDAGDTVEYDITISNGNGSTDFNAYDIQFADTLPVELSNLSLLGVSYNGSASNNGGSDFELVGGVLRSASGANIDIGKGGSITLRVSGQVQAAAANEERFSNTASVQWTSLDGSVSGERSGADGVLNGGSLNDYRSDNTLVVPIAQGVQISHIGGLPDTAAPNPTSTDETTAIGEIVRYRVVGIVAEGSSNDFSFQVTLQNGLQFINDGSTRIAFVSSNGISTNLSDLITSGTLQVTGDQHSAEVQAITPDLSGAAATGVFNTGAHLDISTDASGNQVLTFHLGNLVNSDNDADHEGVALEFNAQVLNVASNSDGKTLSVSAIDRAGSTDLSTAASVVEHVVEPTLTGLNKQITAFDPNPSGSSGSATVAISFSASGDAPAFNTELSDGYPAGSNLTPLSVAINGTVYALNAVPGAIGFSYTVTGNSIDATFARLDPGTTVQLVYQVTLPNSSSIASTDARLTWTSLPDSFSQWGGSSVGSAGGSTGERTGTGSSPNIYTRTEGAGLGVIGGTLWDDTASASADATPDGAGLAGLTVTLTWAGVDGDFATTADNLTYTTTTDANGHYLFGVLAAGNYQISTPATATFAQPVGDVAVRIDSDSASALGQINLTLGEAATGSANAGYVEQNDAPVNHLPASLSGAEDLSFNLAGLSISDVDAANGAMQVTLTVAHGVLSLSSTPAGVSASGQNSATLVLSGNVANINAALAGLLYQGNSNYNGSDTLTMTTSDNGNFGDHDGNGIPGQASDALSVQNTLAIGVTAVNDAPVGAADVASASEAGGTSNLTPGIDPRGNLLSNDTDVDIATNGDSLRVVTITNSSGVTHGLPNIGSSVLNGLYGALTLNSSGGYQYTVDNSNAAVQALRLSGQTLTETFTYVLSDVANAHATSTLTITIHGANDTPTLSADSGNATEAGGVLNSTAGSAATGNVLTNDSDVDSAGNGEALHVTGIRNQPVSDTGPLTNVASGSTSANGTQIVGAFGTLTLGADGSYRYVVDNNNATVQALSASSPALQDTFSYQVTDAGGLSALANLVINVHGANDNPLASDDAASTTAGSVALGTAEINPSGNVLTDASRPGSTTQAGGNGIDTDVDALDQAAGALTVTGARTGSESAGGAFGNVTAGSSAASNALVLVGQYGTLRLGADGSYSYDVDSTNAAVRALNASGTLSDRFTYRISDSTGLTDTAQLVVTVHGVNDQPLPVADTAQAQEAGVSAGINPSGNVLSNDADPDGDSLSVSAIRTSGGVAGSVGAALLGQFGSLTLNADGSYSYVVDNANAQVNALRTSADTLSEQFVYTVADGHGGSNTATLTLVIAGQNDAPVAQPDHGDATEAGGSANATPGIDATGNVLSNDSDVDSGDSKTVNAARSGTLAAGGALTSVSTATVLSGQYGTLTLQSDGSYVYAVDNNNASVNALAPGQSLNDVFTYRVVDAGGATASAEIQISVHGAWDAPVAHLDLNYALSDNGNGVRVDAQGLVLRNDTDVDNGDHLTVTAVGTGIPTSNPTLNVVAAGSSSSSNATVLIGTYGTLTLGADGSYSYVIDVNNPTVVGLTGRQFRLDEFSYQVTDAGGLHDVGRLSIIVRGRNDAPLPTHDSAVAVEAGGDQNTSAGVNPNGNVLSNDTDPDGDTFSVVSLHAGSGLTGPSVGAGTPLQGNYGVLTLNTDGSWSYAVNNDLPAVQALRSAGQTLSDQFTYVVADQWGASASTTLTVVIEGANDTPVAHDDTASAQEAGGVHNATAGLDPSGNVLNNDSDVDSVANGESASVASFANSQGDTAVAGNALAGLYGTLTLSADGSWHYAVDNNNATVEALRASSAPLTEVFSYQMQDAAGATASAHLTIQISGVNDAPVAHDDSNLATDQTPAPQASGNVLPNDTDVDAGDSLNVIGVHSGGKDSTGAPGQIGQPLAGQYGTLTLHADGSYSYQIDLSNPAVLQAAGRGQVLADRFTYTTADQQGASDQAVLTIHLDISAPYIPPAGGAGPHADSRYDPTSARPDIRQVEPVVYVTPEVQANEIELMVNAWEADGSDLDLVRPLQLQSTSLGAGLGQIDGVFVANAVRASRLISEMETAWVEGRHSRIDLSADQLLSDPSAFAPSAAAMLHNQPAHHPAVDVPDAAERPAAQHPTRHDHPPAHPAHKPHQAALIAPAFSTQLLNAAPALPSLGNAWTPRQQQEA